jgi:hypothetical protein
MEYKMSWSHVDCIHLSSLNVHHIGMVEATRLKLWRQVRLQCHNLPAVFHENMSIGSQVISGDTQTAWWPYKPYFDL